MSQSERGDYRAIRQVLLDGPEFQALSERARFALLVMRIGSGPTGLDVEYELGAVEKVANRTGMGARAAKKAFEELKNSRRIVREGNITWIIGQLDDEPNMRPSDKNHRKSVQRYVAGLPRLTIVRLFVEAHPAWFPEEEVRAVGLGWTLPEGPTETPPKTPHKGPASTNNQQPNTNYQRPTTDGAGPGVPPSESAPAAAGFGKFGPLATLLPSDADRDALKIILETVEHPPTWYFEMTACLDCMAGHTPLEIGQLAWAIRSYVGNGAVKRKNMREFKAYLRDAARPEEDRQHRPAPSTSTNGRIERGRAALARFAGGTDGE